MGSLVGLCDLSVRQRNRKISTSNKTKTENGYLKVPGRKTSSSVKRPPSSCSLKDEQAPMNTGLLIACSNGDEFTLRRVMVRRKLSSNTVNMADSSGRTALSHACASGNITILELLLMVPGVDPNMADKEGNTPLHLAAAAGHSDVVAKLLSHFKDIEVDAMNSVGLTPLMKAALQGKTKIVRMLLNSGANPTIRDSMRGMCAHEWANFCGRHQTARIIESFIRYHKVPISDDEQSTSSPSSTPAPQSSLVVVKGTNDGNRLLQRLKAAFQRHLPGSKSSNVSVGLARNMSGTVLCSTDGPDDVSRLPFRVASAAANLNLLAVPKLKVSNVKKTEKELQILREEEKS